MKLAVLVKSCHRDLDRGCHEAIRGTWARDLKTVGVETYFFVGKDPTQQETRRVRKYVGNEVVLDCQDDYISLPVKTRRICQWVGNKMFDHVFLCDVDTMIKARDLMSCGFEAFDYAGRFHRDGSYPGCPPFRYKDEYDTYTECRAWASGGIGYFLSRRAAAVVADTPPTYWAEDMYVGQVLAPEFDEKRMLGSAMTIGGGVVTSHFPKTGAGGYEPQYMKMAMEAGSFENLFRTGKLVA